MKPECRNCQHWDGNTPASDMTDEQAKLYPWGMCRQATRTDSLAMPVTYGEPVAAKLKTHARFGCNQFEPHADAGATPSQS